ncbi:hypothetical protein KEM48_006064 [Puccinia striiformis f. sp. tritici PST-130]|nr:hypothetical protein KEM48_006064 [Puccinia striiformis f. sp. tritici PST-130]
MIPLIISLQLLILHLKDLHTFLILKLVINLITLQELQRVDQNISHISKIYLILESFYRRTHPLYDLDVDLDTYTQN